MYFITLVLGKMATNSAKRIKMCYDYVTMTSQWLILNGLSVYNARAATDWF